MTGSVCERECVLFIGTQFSILYTFMYSPAWKCYFVCARKSLKGAHSIVHPAASEASFFSWFLYYKIILEEKVQSVCQTRAVKHLGTNESYEPQPACPSVGDWPKEECLLTNNERMSVSRFNTLLNMV